MVTANTVTPSAWWFLAPVALVAVGALVAVTIMVLTLFSTASAVVDSGVRVPAGDTARVDVADAGELVVFVEYASATGGALVDPPAVVVLGPDGGEIRLTSSNVSQSWSSGATHLVSLSSLDASTPGTYRVVVGPSSGGRAEGIVIAPDPLSRLAGALGVAVVVSVVALGVALVVVVWLVVRRRRSRTGVR